MSEKLVFSTSGKQPKNKTSQKTYEKSEGPTKMRLETKGRGGKSVTVLFNLAFDSADAKSLMKDLQSQLACGASFKDGRIEFRGDMRDKIEAIFKAKQIKVVRAGG